MRVFGVLAEGFQAEADPGQCASGSTAAKFAADPAVDAASQGPAHVHPQQGHSSR